MAKFKINDSYIRNKVLKDKERIVNIWHIFHPTIVKNNEKAFKKYLIRKPDYLTLDDLAELEKELQISPIVVPQFGDEALLIPAGSMTQRLSIHSSMTLEVDFVSPESFARCVDKHPLFELKNKVRLQLKNMAFHKVKQALSVLK